ncbi:MAG: CD1375 family protein [Escherichia coli]|nr:CD1375 family protein [Escherichia coli]
MAKVYYRMIKLGKMTLEQVPALWRADVEKALTA